MKDVLESFKVTSRVFYERGSFKDISRIFHNFPVRFMIFKGVSRMFKGRFKKTFKVFKKVSCFMALIAASRAEGGLVFENEGFLH